VPSRYRWVVLATGTVALTSFSAIYFGIAVLAPELRDTYGLSLGEAGVLLAATNVGALLTLLPWGLAADRFGERRVIVSGAVAVGALATCAAAAPDALLFVLLFAAGLASSTSTPAGGRLVLLAFPRDRHGLALSIRQCGIPAGALVAAALLPNPAVAALPVVALVWAACLRLGLKTAT
jgi:MFS family permease